MKNLNEKATILKKEIMSLYDISNSNFVNVDVERYFIEITLPTNGDIIDDFMEMGRSIIIDLQTLSFKETVSLFNMINNKVENLENVLVLKENEPKTKKLVELVTQFVFLNNLISKDISEEANDFDDDFENRCSRKREHKDEEIKRQKNRKAGLLRKEFLSGTGKFSDKTNKNDNEC
jgi:hypothetical protein